MPVGPDADAHAGRREPGVRARAVDGVVSRFGDLAFVGLQRAQAMPATPSDGDCNAVPRGLRTTETRLRERRDTWRAIGYGIDTAAAQDPVIQTQGMPRTSPLMQRVPLPATALEAS
jgi:hypothetical protein